MSTWRLTPSADILTERRHISTLHSIVTQPIKWNAGHFLSSSTTGLLVEEAYASLDAIKTDMQHLQSRVPAGVSVVLVLKATGSQQWSDYKPGSCCSLHEKWSKIAQSRKKQLQSQDRKKLKTYWLKKQQTEPYMLSCCYCYYYHFTAIIQDNLR